MNRAWSSGLVPIALAVASVALACQGSPESAPSPPAAVEAQVEAGTAPVEAPTPQGEQGEMEPQVKARLFETRSAALEAPLSAQAWGRYGMVAHAHELWSEAADAYRQAEKCDASDARWPYFLGDVLSVQGGDLEAAVRAFERARTHLPDYPPLHMRLGNVLITLDRVDEAGRELERAIELAPDLDPARVALAQVRLAEGELDIAEDLLERVLAGAPRHGQALATLGRVYMRQGRRDEARDIATRARDAASYNLYEDSLMSQVVAEGVSTVQIWERAKGFLENENYEQAVLGLRQVVVLQPDNADAHLQIAVAYGSLGDLDRSKYHLERTVVLEPDLVPPRLNLARMLLDQRQAPSALAHLRVAVELEPDNADAGWLLGRALSDTGDFAGAVTAFEADGSASGSSSEPPAWVHNAWGQSLARLGQAEAALGHFEAAVALRPDDPQAHFFTGLVLEGLGRVDEAVVSYCRSTRAAGRSPADGRLRELGRSCPGG